MPSSGHATSRCLASLPIAAGGSMGLYLFSTSLTFAVGVIFRARPSSPASFYYAARLAPRRCRLLAGSGRLSFITISSPEQAVVRAHFPALPTPSVSTFVCETNIRGTSFCPDAGAKVMRRSCFII